MDKRLAAALDVMALKRFKTVAAEKLAAGGPDNDELLDKILDAIEESDSPSELLARVERM